MKSITLPDLSSPLLGEIKVGKLYSLNRAASFNATVDGRSWFLKTQNPCMVFAAIIQNRKVQVEFAQITVTPSGVEYQPTIYKAWVDYSCLKSNNFQRRLDIRRAS